MIFSQPGFPPTWEQNGGPINRGFSFTLQTRKQQPFQLAEKHRIFASNLYSYGWFDWLSVFNIFLDKSEFNRPIIGQTQHNPAKLYPNSKGWILSHEFALFIRQSSYFSGPWFDTKCKDEIDCMYPFDICNNFNDFDNLHILILSTAPESSKMID